MGTNSAESVYFYGTKAVGVPYRVQAQFGGDSTNAAAGSGWYYFRFTS